MSAYVLVLYLCCIKTIMKERRGWRDEFRGTVYSVILTNWNRIATVLGLMYDNSNDRNTSKTTLSSLLYSYKYFRLKRQISERFVNISNYALLFYIKLWFWIVWIVDSKLSENFKTSKTIFNFRKVFASNKNYCKISLWIYSCYSQYFIINEFRFLLF
jgi:hypothetical protein